MQGNLQSASDEDLMLLVGRGDEGAFVELIDRHQQRVLNIAYRYMCEQTEAEDIAQEAFIKVYKARKSYKPTAKFTTWLHRIAVNICLNSIRDRKHSPVVGIAEDDLLKGAVSKPQEKSETDELKEIVKSAVMSLPDNQKMAIILSKYEELSYNEISDVMELSVEAVKSLIFRAKDVLKEKLAKYVK